nr:MAG TPA: hypothetical protein [Caudoviricetes sp.]
MRKRTKVCRKSCTIICFILSQRYKGLAAVFPQIFCFTPQRDSKQN